MKKLITISLLFLSLISIGQKKTAFQIFNKNGKKITFEKMLSKMKSADIILFGELHNNPIAHWLQYELAHELVKTNKLTLGAEMFEADNQQAINSYLAETIDKKGLDSTARLWKNFKTDYAPILDIAKDNKLNFIATNVPRIYANKVYANGFDVLDSLSQVEKSWMAPLPIDYNAELECYKNIMAAAHGHGGENLPKAQALKDATMAYFILQNFEQGTTFMHYNGSYHSDIFQGILWYLKQKQQELNYITITTVLQSNPNILDDENKKKANYIIVVDENMTTTY